MSLTATIEEAAKYAKAIFGGGGLARIADLVARHEWGELVDLGITDIAQCIAIGDPALAGLAPLAAEIIIYARHHPATIAQQKPPEGPAGNPWESKGAYPTGGIGA